MFVSSARHGSFLTLGLFGVKCGDTIHRSWEAVMSVPASRKRKRLLCRFNLKHNWVRRFNQEDGQDYLQCTACGKEHSYFTPRAV